MNKQERQELSKRLTCLEASCKNLGTEIQIIKARLAETEKPKLEHSDCGLSEAAKLPFIILNGKAQWLENSCGVSLININDDAFTKTPILFNLADLMKDWGEPLWEFEKTCINGGTLRINRLSDGKIQFCIRAGNDYRYATGTHDQVYEIWCKLGQILMGHKRKQS